MKLLLLVLLSPLFLYGQSQIGDDIDGRLAGDNAGHTVAVSSNGSIVALGSPSYDGNSPGSVSVFKNINNNWIQIGVSIYGDAIGDHFGNSVSLSGDGNTLAIGGPNNANDGIDTGHVRIFENISGDWTQIGNDINGEAIGDQAGLFVSLSDNGSTIAISGFACCGLFHGTPGVGKTRIYENSNGNWIQIGDQIRTGLNGLSSISLSEDGLVMAIASSGGGNPCCSNFYSGGVKVYQNISREWVQKGSTIYGEHTGFWQYNFIGSVSLNQDGSKMAISGSNYSRVFEFIHDEWTQEGEDFENGDFYFNNYYNNSISLSDDGTKLIYANYYNSVVPNLARVYENSSGSWIQLGVDIMGESIGDSFGASLEVSGDGTTMIVGAPYNDANGSDAGHARVYDLRAILSVEESSMLGAKLYPNPAKHQFMIVLPGSHTVEKINIYNGLGQLAKTTAAKSVNTSDLASGIYYVEIITNSGKATKKLILQ